MQRERKRGKEETETVLQSGGLDEQNIIEVFYSVVFATNIRVYALPRQNAIDWRTSSTYQMTRCYVLPQLHCTQHDYFLATYIIIIVVVAIFFSAVDFIEMVCCVCSNDDGSNGSSRDSVILTNNCILTTYTVVTCLCR